MIFSRQSLIGTWQILEGCAGFPKKPTGRMPGRCFCHCFWMLPHLQIGSGNDLDRRLCAWRCKCSACFRSNAGCQWIIENFLNFYEAILPGRKQHDQRYTQHRIIRNFRILSWSVRYLRIESSQVVETPDCSEDECCSRCFCIAPKNDRRLAPLPRFTGEKLYKCSTSKMKEMIP